MRPRSGATSGREVGGREARLLSRTVRSARSSSIEADSSSNVDGGELAALDQALDGPRMDVQ